MAIPPAGGWWIVRNDPDPVRGRICGAFQVALAFWMGAPAAIASVFALGLIENLRGRPANGDTIAITLVSLLVAIVASCAIGFVASLMAVWFRVQVWVHPRLVGCLGDELHVSETRFNCGVFVLATSIGFPVLAVGSFFAVQPAGPWVVPLVFLGGPIIAVIGYRWFARRIFAASLVDYWRTPNQNSGIGSSTVR